MLHSCIGAEIAVKAMPGARKLGEGRGQTEAHIPTCRRSVQIVVTYKHKHANGQLTVVKHA